MAQTVMAEALERAGALSAHERIKRMAEQGWREAKGNALAWFAALRTEIESDPSLILEVIGDEWVTLLARYFKNHPSRIQTAIRIQRQKECRLGLAKSPQNGARRQSVFRKRRSAGITVVRAEVDPAGCVTILDTWKIRDGRPIGEVRFGELPRLHASNVQEAAVIRQLMKLGVADPNAKIKDIVKVEELQRMIQRAAEVADAA